MQPSQQPMGFVDTVAGSQTAFRAVLAAMAEPGRVVVLPDLPAAPAGLSPAAAAVLLALADFETPLWLDTQDEAIITYLRFETGAQIVAEPAAAAFALATRCDALPEFELFAQGVPEYPDRSTTLVMQVAGLAVEGADALVLSGPGIAATTRLGVSSLPADFRARMAANRACFPLGLDIVLAAGDRVACLPRSVNVA